MFPLGVGGRRHGTSAICEVIPMRIKWLYCEDKPWATSPTPRGKSLKRSPTVYSTINHYLNHGSMSARVLEEEMNDDVGWHHEWLSQYRSERRISRDGERARVRCQHATHLRAETDKQKHMIEFSDPEWKLGWGKVLSRRLNDSLSSHKVHCLCI